MISPLLKKNGLNMLAVFNLETLPTELLESLQSSVEDLSSYSQILVFAHGGKEMWQALQASPFKSATDPIDSFSMHVVQNYFSQALPNNCYLQLYPHSKRHIAMRQLGQLAGWHYDSAFRIGINEVFGSWFAYRVVVLSNTKLTPSKRVDSASPCDTCEDKPCISVCPAKALDKGDLNLQTCLNYRQESNSRCKTQCISRIICPIAKEHRYSPEQINYHYAISMKFIEAHQGNHTTKG